MPFARYISLAGRRITLLFSVPFLLTLVSGAPWPAPEPSSYVTAPATDNGFEEGETYAIVIGISKYKNISSLRYADRDALAFAHYLRQLSGHRTDSANIKVLINEDATLDNVADVMNDFLQGSKPGKNDRFYFYFAGHGDIESRIYPDEGLLLLYGAPKNNYFIGSSAQFLSTRTLFNALLKPLLERRVHVAVITDACHAAAGSNVLSGGSEGGRVTRAALEGIKVPTKIFSCKETETSIESEQFGGGRGLFSYAFLKGLYGDADEDKDGLVSMREIRNYTETNVRRMANPDRQTPEFYADDLDWVMGKVDKKFYADFQKDESSQALFASHVNYRSKKRFWLQGLFNKAKNNYKTCIKLLEDGEVDRAYAHFKATLAWDSVSMEAIQLRRLLSEEYQKAAEKIIIPMTENITRGMPNLTQVQIARHQLSYASELLGSRHYLADYYQARLLFLKVLGTDFNSSQADMAAGIQDLKAAMRLEPNAPYNYFLAASLYQRSNQFDSARKYYKYYTDLIPHSSWAHNNMGLVCAEMGDDAAAISSFEKAISIDPRSGRAHNNLGNVYLRQKKYSKAIECFQRATEHWRNSETPLVNLGIAYQENKQEKEAIQAFESALNINPDEERASLQLGHLYFNQRAYQKAAVYFERAARLNPANKSIRRLMAEAYDATGDVKNAFYNYGLAIQYDPANKTLKEKYSPLLLKLAKQRKDVDYDYAGAARMFEEYNRLHPNKPDVLLSMAQCYLLARDYVQSLAAFKKLLPQQAANKQVLNGYALSLYNLQQHEEATTALQKALQKDPKNIDLLFPLTCAYAVLEKEKEFYQSLDKLLSSGGDKQTILRLAVDAKELDSLRRKEEFKKTFQKYYTATELQRAYFLFIPKKRT